MSSQSDLQIQIQIQSQPQSLFQSTLNLFLGFLPSVINGTGTTLFEAAVEIFGEDTGFAVALVLELLLLADEGRVLRLAREVFGGLTLVVFIGLVAGVVGSVGLLLLIHF